jgi:thiol:disulfide interchange protein
MTTTTREIAWQRDVDQAIAEAGRTHRPVLLDFTAAPL